MNRRHVTSRLDTRLPVGRSRRCADAVDSRFGVSPCRVGSSKQSPRIKSAHSTDSDSEKLDGKTTKAVEPLSRSPKWSRIKNRFEKGPVTASKIPTSRRSPLPEKAVGQTLKLNRRMPVMKEGSTSSVTAVVCASNAVSADITNKNIPEKLAIHEFKSARLVAKRLLESRPKRPSTDAENVCSTHYMTKAVSEASGSDRVPQIKGPTYRQVQQSSGTLTSSGASDTESQPLALKQIHSDNSVLALEEKEISFSLPETKTANVEADDHSSQATPTLLHIPTSKLRRPENVSVTIVNSNAAVSSQSENTMLATNNSEGTTSSRLDKPIPPQVPPKNLSNGSHVIQISIEHPKAITKHDSRDSTQNTPSVALDCDTGDKKSTCEDGRFSYSALVPYRCKRPDAQKVSKVASLAKSFENLIHLDNAFQGPQCLKRGTVCHRSLPSETIHEMRKRFGKSGNSSSCRTIERPLSVALDRSPGTVSRASSFCRSSESMEEMQTRPKIRVAVRRSNSIASQSTTYLRAESVRSEYDSTAHKGSVTLTNKVINGIGLTNPASSPSLLQTVDALSPECKSGYEGYTAAGGEKKFSVVQQAVMNFEANSQVAMQKNYNKLIDLSSGVATRRKSVEMSRTDFQASRSRSASASFDDRASSAVEGPTGTRCPNTDNSLERKPALPPKGVGIRQFRQVPPPSPSSSLSKSQSITVSVMASVTSEASDRFNVTKTRDLLSNSDDTLASGDTSRQSVRPNQSFLWKLGMRPQVRPPINGSQDEYAEENIYDTLSNCRTVLSSDEGVVVSENASEKSCKDSPVPDSSGRAASLPKALESHLHAPSVDSDEGWADVSDYEFDNGKGTCKDRKPFIRKDRRSWSHNLRELVTNMNSDGSDKGYEDVTWELVDTGDSSSSSTTYDHLYEPIYDLLEKDGVPPDLIPETDDVYAEASVHRSGAEPFCPKGRASSSCTARGSLDVGKNKPRCSSDIHLQLSSRFNLVKIKKSAKSATEIGVGVCVGNSRNSKSKKKAIVDCILRPGQSQSKRNSMFGGGSKKETATFYVHLSVDRDVFDGQKRRHSDGSDAGMGNAEGAQQSIHSGIAQRNAPRRRPIRRVSSSAGTIRRPNTPPPLPPTAAKGTEAPSKPSSDSQKEAVTIQRSESSLSFFSGSAVTESRSGSGSISPMDDTFPPVFGTSLMSDLASYTRITDSNTDDTGFMNAVDAPSTEARVGEETSLEPRALKSPFLEEPLYQFYQKDLVERACHWRTGDASTTEEDDATSVMQTAQDSNQTEDSDTDDKISNHESSQCQQRSAMELLQNTAGTGLRTLWCEVPEVIESGVLTNMTPQDARLQEAMFEVITSEASYLKSLNVLVDHFVRCPDFKKDEILHPREWRALFADIFPVRTVCENLLADFEKRWKENIVISDVCDILYDHTTNHFGVYVRYCSNQIHQDRLLKELRETRPEFVEVLQRLEADTKCHGLNMYSFLMLPMQRITRLPLLVDAIFKRLNIDSPKYTVCKETLAALNKVVSECNDGARKMERMEEMLHISRILEFKDCKAIPLISSSRWLIKRGELLRVTFDLNAKRTFGRSVRYSKSTLYLFLFTDLLLLTKKKGDEYYSVVDYCPRNMVQISSTEGEDSGIFLPPRLPDCCRNLFQMTILQNHEGKMVEMLLSAESESDKTRWIDALTPVMSSNPDERIYEEWDCPQVQCRHAYIPKQPDELALDESDVVNVFRKMSDGWYEGERIRDGARGWFPASHTVEVINLHVRSRNLRQRYRLLMATQSYLEGQLRARNGSKGK